MKNFLVLILFLAVLQSCTSNKSGGFQVEGTIKDTSFAILYLEQVRTEDNQPFVVDSTRPDKNGRFSLHAPVAEDHIYYLRSDKQGYPICLLVNDSKSIELTIQFEQMQGRKVPTYTVKGSPATEQVRAYADTLSKWMMTYVNDLIALDTITQKTGTAPDSLLKGVQMQSKNSIIISYFSHLINRLTNLDKMN